MRFSWAIWLLPLGGFWAVLIHQLGAQWSAYEQYHYGWAVPVLCLYLIWQKKRGQSTEARGQGGGVSGVASQVSGGRERSSILYCLLACAALFYAPTRWLHEANPIWRLTSLLLAVETIAITLLVLQACSPVVSMSCSPVVPLSRGLLFPLCFFLVAVPWPSGLENLVVQSLTRLNVSATVELLGVVGVPALQHGNAIEVGTGMVGIDEGCSGIRSFQATLMIALFLGELYRLSWRRRLFCVGAGFGLAFLFNLARTSLLTWVAAHRGTAAVATWHDPAGVTILVGCFLALWLLALGLAHDPTSPVSPANNSPIGQSAIRNPQSAISWWSRNLVVSFSLLAWLGLVEGGTELWYRWHERGAPARQWGIETSSLGPSFQKSEVPPNIAAQFHADEALQGRWRDAAGDDWQLYYFRWLPSRSLSRRVAVQLAKTHGPEKCLPAIGMSLKSYLGVIKVPFGNQELALQQYLFRAEGRQVHVFYGIHEDSGGPGVLAARRQTNASRLAAALAGSRNYGQSYLELAVTGMDDPQAAQAALRRQLPRILKEQGRVNEQP